MKTVEITKVYAPDTVYIYRLTNMMNSSAKYGACMVCDKPVSEVHLQTEYGQYPKQGSGYSWMDRCGLWGHKDCVIGARKIGNRTTPMKKLTIGSSSWEVVEQ